MSDLQKAFAKAKLGVYPANPPVPFNEVEEDGQEEEKTGGVSELPVDDDSSSASSASSASSTGTIIPSSNQNLFARPQGCVHSISLSLESAD
jgi:protein phosphatase methylesterase 1